ncbi:DUF397 domain-containing protein [Sphaerisporangium rhizosphaerae]|uniref:DUF397 domain-containing protein n=1 Tax=Sphaerisporangium rhizosphaerae TaxID=2269375 RepID=A0ABW2PJH1_9ACTN
MDLDRVKWQKSSYTGNNGGNCVEVAQSLKLIAVRDSKRPDGPKLFFTPGEWNTFIGDVKAGRFDQA